MTPSPGFADNRNIIVQTRPTLGLFAYPWDILDRGISAFVRESLDLGVTGLFVPPLYHSAKVLLPRNTRAKVYFSESGCLYFRPGHDRFGEVKPQPGSLAAAEWLPQLSVEANSSGLSLTAWTVVNHSSVLGSRYPHLAIRNVFGDPYPFALCPSQAAVQEYAVALARTIADTGHFNTIALETIGYLGYEHGHHHEMAGVPLGPLEKFLLSLCFCSACRSEAGRRGIDMDGLAHRIRDLLDRKFRCDDACDRNPHNREQLAALVALWPPLQDLVRLRLETVTALTRRVREAAGAMRLTVFTSGFVGAPANIWMEGVDIEHLREAVDAFHLLEYAPDVPTANQDLAMCLFLAQTPARLNLTLNLGVAITPTLAHAMGKIAYAWRQGVRDFSFYNYGLLGEGRLGWLRDIAHWMRQQQA